MMKNYRSLLSALIIALSCTSIAKANNTGNFDMPVSPQTKFPIEVLEDQSYPDLRNGNHQSKQIISAIHNYQTMVVCISNYTGNTRVYLEDAEGIVVEYETESIINNGYITLSIGNLGSGDYTLRIFTSKAYYGILSL